MKKLKSYILVIYLALAFVSCGKKVQNVPGFSVSKIFKTDTVTTVNVHISSRITAGQLLLIAGKLKTDSAKIQNLEIHYLLPGNTETSAGDNSYYASARFVTENDIKSTDTLKDDNGNVVRLKIFGLNEAQVKRLLTMQPKEIAGKDVLGRFIDDYNHTVIIPFKDPLDKKSNLYIVELDSSAKVVSATMPLKMNDAGVEKWMVTQHGDYLTLKDSILTQYAADGLGLPFNSIKSGI